MVLLCFSSFKSNITLIFHEKLYSSIVKFTYDIAVILYCIVVTYVDNSYYRYLYNQYDY